MSAPGFCPDCHCRPCECKVTKENPAPLLRHLMQGRDHLLPDGIFETGVGDPSPAKAITTPEPVVATPTSSGVEERERETPVTWRSSFERYEAKQPYCPADTSRWPDTATPSLAGQYRDLNRQWRWEQWVAAHRMKWIDFSPVAPDEISEETMAHLLAISENSREQRKLPYRFVEDPDKRPTRLPGTIMQGSSTISVLGSDEVDLLLDHFNRRNGNEATETTCEGRETAESQASEASTVPKTDKSLSCQDGTCGLGADVVVIPREKWEKARELLADADEMLRSFYQGFDHIPKVREALGMSDVTADEGGGE